MFIKELIQDTKAMGGFPFFELVSFSFLFLGHLNVFLQLTAGLIFAFAFSFSLRLLFFRERPIKEKYHNIFGKIDASSFPSLHAMRASLLATVCALFFNNIFLYFLFAFCAIGAGYCRVIQKRHHLSDVIFGLVFGVIIGVLVVRLI